MKKHFLKGVCGILYVLTLLSCSNPLETRHVIRTLIDEPLSPGHYLLYWNGRDEKGKTVVPGTYFCVLECEEYVQQIEMTAIEGTKGRPADSTGTPTGLRYIESQPLHYILEQNFPNPFYAQDGTNIPFSIPAYTYVRLMIREK